MLITLIFSLWIAASVAYCEAGSYGYIKHPTNWLKYLENIFVFPLTVIIIVMALIYGIIYTIWQIFEESSQLEILLILNVIMTVFLIVIISWKLT